VLDAAYLRAAPAAVGVSQYPNSKAYYRQRIRAVLGEDRDPAAIHALGLERLRQIDHRLEQLRAEVGFSGTRAEFDQYLKTNARFLARTPEELEARFNDYLDRTRPFLARWFKTLPRAPYAIKRIDAAAELGMSYGEYQPPTASDSVGYYLYNGSHLETRTLVGAEHLIFHELMPGHHLQVALTREASGIHPLQRFLACGAYEEGWAEYAAALAEDAGLYDPYDLYGHLMMQSFLAARLVLDTGMNELGWPLKRARAFMAEHTLEGASQVETETLRYSTDIPGQAIGYYLGYEKFQELRSRARAALGPAFELKEFHAAVLAGGAVPLGALDREVESYIETARVAYGATPIPAPTHFAAFNTVHFHIEASAPAVWKTLLARERWGEGFVEKRHVSGPENAVGEKAIYSILSSNGEIHKRLEEVLYCIADEHLVLRLAPPDDGATDTFVDFHLSPDTTGTRVSMNVYWMDQAPAGDTSEDVSQLRDSYRKQTQAGMERQLSRLRRAAEGSGP